MERMLSVIFLIGAGVVLLIVARRGYVSGELPAGTAYLRRYRPNRDDNPLAFHCYLVLYVGMGMAFLVWGILALTGGAAPLRLR